MNASRSDPWGCGALPLIPARSSSGLNERRSTPISAGVPAVTFQSHRRATSLQRNPPGPIGSGEPPHGG